MVGLLREYRASTSAFRRALRPPALRKLLLAYGVAAATEAATWLAIGVYAYDDGGAAAVGVVGLVLLLPAAFAAPVAASVADQHRRQRVLLASYAVVTLLVALVATAMLAGWPSWMVYGFAMGATVAITPLRPTNGAFLPSISSDPADLTAANIGLTTIRNIGLLLGPAAAGLLLRGRGPAAVFAMSAMLLTAATVSIGIIPADPRRPEARSRRRVVQGVRLLARESRATLVVGLTFAKHIVMGSLRAFLVVVALELLGLGSGGPALLSVALGVGGAMGGATSVLLVGRRRLTPALLGGVLLLGVPLMVLGAWPTVGVAMLALSMAGVGRSLVDVSGRTLLGRIAPEEATARFFGMLEGSSFAGLALGSGAAAILIQAIGTRWALVAIGALLPLLTLVLLVPLRAVDRSPLVSRDRLQLLLGVPMFTPLPAPSIERIAAQLEPIDVPTDTLLIRQGDVGDRFYILASGAAEAIVDETVVARYGPGDSFGEIALLRDLPRTATVHAIAPSTVMALGRVPFLSVLTDEPDGMLEAERVVAERIRDTTSRRHGSDLPST